MVGVGADTAATVDDLVASQTTKQRFLLGLLTVFGLLALGIASLGVYAVMADLVAKQRTEIAIRGALGMRPIGAIMMLGRQAFGVGGAAVVVGTPIAAALARLASGFLYGVPAWDGRTYAEAVAVLVTCLVAATIIPASRAARVQPSSVLRQ